MGHSVRWFVYALGGLAVLGVTPWLCLHSFAWLWLVVPILGLWVLWLMREYQRFWRTWWKL